MQDVASRSESAAHAYERGDYSRAIMLLDEVIAAAPYSTHGLASRILRASAYEGGRTPVGRSLDLALADYEFLAEVVQEVGSVGVVGIARVLARRDMCANAEQVGALCARAVEIDGSPEAELVLGDLCALAHLREGEARKHYRRAVSAGDVRGHIKIAMSYEREGRKVKSALHAFRYLLVSAMRRRSSPSA